MIYFLEKLNPPGLQLSYVEALWREAGREGGKERGRALNKGLGRKSGYDQ